MRAGAAYERLRAGQDARRQAASFDPLEAAQWSAVSTLLERLSDELSRATEEVVALARKAQVRAAGGALIGEIRAFAIREANRLIEQLAEPGGPPMAPIRAKGARAIRKECE